MTRFKGTFILTLSFLILFLFTTQISEGRPWFNFLKIFPARLTPLFWLITLVLGCGSTYFWSKFFYHGQLIEFKALRETPFFVASVNAEGLLIKRRIEDHWQDAYFVRIPNLDRVVKPGDRLFKKGEFLYLASIIPAADNEMLIKTNEDFLRGKQIYPVEN